MLSETAQLNRVFEKRPISPRRTDFDSDRQFKALNISNNTKQVNVMVVSRLFTSPSVSISCVYTSIVPIITIDADVRTRLIRAFVNTGAFRLRGGRLITSGSTGSTPRDCAGGPSMIISRIC